MRKPVILIIAFLTVAIITSVLIRSGRSPQVFCDAYLLPTRVAVSDELNGFALLLEAGQLSFLGVAPS